MLLGSVQRARQVVRRHLRRRAHILRLTGCFSVITLATFLVGLENGGELIWLANGILLAYLLLSPRRRWPHFVLAGFAGEFAGGMFVDHHRLLAYLLLSVLNVLESVVGGLLLRRRNRELPCLTDRRYVVRFFALGVVVAPGLVGCVFAMLMAIWLKASPWQSLQNWWTTDGLGVAIATPAFLAVLHGRINTKIQWRSDWFYAASFAGIVAAAFLQSSVPVIFLVYPCLAVILLRFGLEWTAIGTLLLTAVSGWATLHGLGPFAQTDWFLPAGPSILVQLYVAAGIFMIYAVSTVLDTLQSTKQRLQETVALHELIVENSRDVIILSEFDGTRRFVSSAAQKWDLWKKEEFYKHTTPELLHPDDKARALAVVDDIRHGSDGALVEFRLRRRNGQYIWVEANLRPVRTYGTRNPAGVLNMMRDISQRKLAEQELQDAYRALETLAVTDPLTHLANRRHFDQFMTTEWRRCLRERTTLSILLVDVDLFKSYNDAYGHLRGDGCLKQVAESAQDVASRPTDLVARFGGEEFAVVLPNTGLEGAMKVASNLQAALRSRSLEHRGNPTGQVTVSIGCATAIPALGQHAASLIQRADDAMYAAKSRGRNQVCSADEPDFTEVSSRAS